ncbi:hypothetical protein MESS2_730032 [Mesorhizobium metallidurans STM 2683]|uniref:Uncharacterized protein n=1 Tax=Mesorhizobium metallidurans STM 2683 TaxID=1297569 RepID=M5F8A3_9HYPH|nr:hypothetical protein [Mesorhizobium metallidurans]CCV08136.1 hypothetical protein MESS2_730032 [Mesorhizobium metallidurans STM 2683]
MGKHEIRTVAEHWLTADQLAEDSMIAVKDRILEAAENDTISFVVAKAEQQDADLVEAAGPVEEADTAQKVEPQQIRLAVSFFHDLEVSILVLYAAYALVVVGVTYLLLRLGHVL